MKNANPMCCYLGIIIQSPFLCIIKKSRLGRKVKTEFEITRPVYSNLEMNIRLFYFCAGNPNRSIAVEKINADVSLGKGAYEGKSRYVSADNN